MIRVNQTVSDPVIGDCFRACLASLFEMRIESIPNFAYTEGTKKLPSDAFQEWLDYIGYDYVYITHEDGDTVDTGHLFVGTAMTGVNGFYIGSVPSKTFLGITHAVIINKDGLVVHDPAPNHSWLGLYPKDELIGYYLFQKL